jgi:flagellar export protein FliJ
MSVLRRLVRYHRHQLDEKRRNLRVLEARAASVEDAIEKLDMRVVAERRVAKHSPDVSGAYGGYARAALDRRAALLTALGEANRAVEAAREELLDAFAEVKRYEISLEHQARREQEEQERRGQGLLDEAALNLYRRRDRA